jgi:hypothetical protein
MRSIVFSSMVSAGIIQWQSATSPPRKYAFAE